MALVRMGGGPLLGIAEIIRSGQRITRVEDLLAIARRRGTTYAIHAADRSLAGPDRIAILRGAASEPRALLALAGIIMGSQAGCWTTGAS
jgi:hypothetical protein